MENITGYAVYKKCGCIAGFISIPQLAAMATEILYNPWFHMPDLYLMPITKNKITENCKEHKAKSTWSKSEISI